MIFKDLYVNQSPVPFLKEHDLESIKITEPIFDEEIWIAMWIKGSRGMSHEIVRHGDFTAISQRSTRYVYESSSDYIWHPLINEYIEKHETQLLDNLDEVEKITKNNYDEWVRILQDYCVQKGMTKFDARKQARGAARGILCNALSTEMIFSANLRQWKWMLKQRMNPAADGEIHEIFKEVHDIIYGSTGRVFNLSGETKMGLNCEG